ncbi:hypothetical protein ASPCAL10799 [Aspergillus calidoustus]|uniref:Uncharacterized protein n=1 Tax=Aspergillus calidoustus TaxID=454130 RepID=A0A0U5CD10_ASPCI|nr:hypothetical protein ASPCAL10799 [Aspergillus calidoustus]
MPDLEASTPRLAIADRIDLLLPAYIRSLEFPALERVGRIGFDGNLSTVSLEALRTVSRTFRISNSSNTLWPPAAETTMSISLPLLESTSIVSFKGNMSSLSLPELTTIKTYKIILIQFQTLNKMALEY